MDGELIPKAEEIKLYLAEQIGANNESLCIIKEIKRFLDDYEKEIIVPRREILDDIEKKSKTLEEL